MLGVQLLLLQLLLSNSPQSGRNYPSKYCTHNFELSTHNLSIFIPLLLLLLLLCPTQTTGLSSLVLFLSFLAARPRCCLPGVGGDSSLSRSTPDKILIFVSLVYQLSLLLSPSSSQALTLLSLSHAANPFSLCMCAGGPPSYSFLSYFFFASHFSRFMH